MRFKRAVTALGALAIAGAVAPAIANAQGFHKQTMKLLVHVGPGDKQSCKVILDLYRPDHASQKHPVPAVLTTNGFGGSKNDQADMAKTMAAQGYGVLSYSGLGFGGSSCRITLDSTQWDGKAASDLVTFLGGGMKATNGTKVNWVKLNRRAANGRHYAHDPEVGMIGGSYGGEVQFAAAADDPRIDTIIPIITWNNIDYSLAPNNATLSGNSVNYSVPGITKKTWLNIFWLIGETGKALAPTPPSACPNFAQVECGEDTELIGDGYPTATTLASTKPTSVDYYMKRIRIPVMLMQGEHDTLFDLQEAAATYSALRKQHTPVKMVWQSWGHSGGTPVPGELGPGTSPYTASGKPTVEGKMIETWLNHYLKHAKAKPAMNFSYFEPWVKYSGDDAAKAYASAPSYPVGTTEKMYLSNAASGASDGSASIVTTTGDVINGTQLFTTPLLGAAESFTSSGLPPSGPVPPPTDPAGTYAEYETAPLASALNVVGVPTLKVTVSAPTDQLALKPAGTLGLFFRLEDISATGTATLPDQLLSPARFPDNGQPVTVELPGIAHQFAKGDRIAVVIAGSDQDYFLPDPDVTVTVTANGSTPDVLSLPVVGGK